MNGTSLNKCICPGEDDFWDSSYIACRRRTGLQGIYVADKLNISDAISNCESKYKGLLATEEHLRQIFSNCTDYADDTWLIGIVYPATEKQLGSCAILYSDGELKTENCTGRRASVCMTKKNNKNDLSCFGFPTVPKYSTSSSGLIGGVVAVLIILAVVVMLVIGLLYRRRKRECNKDSDMVNNQSYELSGTANGRSLKPDIRLSSNPETRPVEDYDYAMGTDNRDAQDCNHSNIYANDMTTRQVNQGYNSSNDMPDYANYTEDRCPPDDKPRGNSVENSFEYMLAKKPNTDYLSDGEYNTFSDQSADLPPTDTYDHVHNVPEDGYDQFQLKSSERSNFEHDDETGYMQSSFPG
ncbi:uncharacterized protein LOC110452568 [Mizuhopecten yessoensis]|uniref:uncharacterized protein LOC110452568 n=1 Tax=Mizuhopecten yessoensis TaxID=6573 RepID=UPI000B45DA84|nr:uncharacterized protein LOC110452568 [Mizuhopecten yessoensis]